MSRVLTTNEVREMQALSPVPKSEPPVVVLAKSRRRVPARVWDLLVISVVGGGGVLLFERLMGWWT